MITIMQLNSAFYGTVIAIFKCTLKRNIHLKVTLCRPKIFVSYS